MALQLFKIASTTVESPATSVTFSSIPQVYTDLILKTCARATASSFDKRLNVLFNNNSANYSIRAIYGIGSTVVSYSTTLAGYVGSIPGSSTTANSFGNSEVYIPNYAGSTNKSYSVDSVNETNDATNNRIDLLAGLWSDTTAISSIVINTNDGTSFNTNSTFTLYGVL